MLSAKQTSKCQKLVTEQGAFLMSKKYLQKKEHNLEDLQHDVFVRRKAFVRCLLRVDGSLLLWIMVNQFLVLDGKDCMRAKKCLGSPVLK